MAFLHLFLTATLLSVSTALLWSRTPTVATSDDREIDGECLALADQGSCEFYTCFERRLPCGRDWYMLRHGHYYCNKMMREKESFTEAGQNFLEDAQRCLTRSLKELYQREYIDCHDLEHEAVSAITPCFVDNAFCDVLNTDHSRFFQMYEMADLFSRGAGKIWRSILGLTTRCGTEAIRELTSDTSDSMVDAFNGFFDALANVGNRVVDSWNEED